MADQPDDEERRRWHRRFAVDSNNRAWALVEKAELRPDERQELLRSAYASAHHWGQVGTEEQQALATLLLAIVHARLGQADLSQTNAATSLAYFESRPSEPWTVAFAHAAVAAAAAVAHDTERHGTHHRIASEIASTLEDEDRRIFMATFCRIPVP